MNPLIDAVLDDDPVAVREAGRRHPELLSEAENDTTPLAVAAQNDSTETMAVLLELGADPNVAMDEGVTALHIASFQGSAACADLLLKHGAVADARSDDGKTALMDAAQAGALEVGRLLMAAGADVKAHDTEGRTALHWLMSGEHDEAGWVSLLLGAGADINARDALGNTPLASAQLMQKPQIIRALQSWRQ